MPARPRQSGKSGSDASNDKGMAATVRSAADPTLADEPVADLRLLGELRPVTSREERIAISAYWRAAQRQFAPGHELDDWLAAESEVDSKDGSGSSAR